MTIRTSTFVASGASDRVQLHGTRQGTIMRGIRHGTGLVLGLGLVIALGGWAGGVFGADPDKMHKADDLTPAGKAAAEKAESGKTEEAPEKPPLKTYTFNMSGKPWAQVFDWLADETGLAMVATDKP